MNRTYALSSRLATLLCSLLVVFALTACMDNVDAPNGTPQITASSLPATNADILSVKQKYRTAITGNNTFEQVKEDVVFEGVVVANDVSGNLYQTLIVRHIGSKAGAEDDQCISLGIKSSQLYPYFPVGQRIRVNLKNLYIGNYSKTPKVGRPYYTSSGNLRLGPMFMEDVATNIELVGGIDYHAPELMPRQLSDSPGVDWLANRSNQSYLNNPMLVIVQGTIDEVQGNEKNNAATGQLSGKTEPLPKVFAPRELYDAGFGVDRHLTVKRYVPYTEVKISLRTSVRNAISFTPIPEDTKGYVGVLTYFSSWQLQLRNTKDIQ